MWEKGRCQNWFNRTCPYGSHKETDLRTYENHYVDNTDSAFRTRCALGVPLLSRCSPVTHSLCGHALQD